MTGSPFAVLKAGKVQIVHLSVIHTAVLINGIYDRAGTVYNIYIYIGSAASSLHTHHNPLIRTTQQGSLIRTTTGESQFTRIPGEFGKEGRDLQKLGNRVVKYTVSEMLTLRHAAFVVILFSINSW